MEFDNKRVVIQDGDDSMQIKDFLLLCVSKWYWFVITISIAVGMAVYVVKSTAPTYSATASILIKQQQESNFGALQEIGLANQKSVRVNNEILVMRSRSVISEVVKRMNLNMEYYRDGMFYKRLLYGSEQPVAVEFLDCANEQYAALTLMFAGTEKFDMTGFVGAGTKEGDDELTLPGNLNDTIQTPLGRVVVTKTQYYRPVYMNIYARHHSVEGTISGCIGRFSVVQVNEKTSIVELSYTDISRARAEDVMTNIIDVYNESWVTDKNQTSVSTALFIADRLSVIEQELGAVDSDISSYRSKNLVPDAEGAASAYMSQVTENDEQIRQLNDQIRMAQNIRTYLTDAFNKSQLLPANTGLNEGGLEGLITQYNTNMMDRNNMVANSSEQNPMVQSKDSELAAMREIILETLSNTLRVLDSRMNSLQQRGREIRGKIASTPMQSQYLLSTERQQSVKEALYLYLLQKREENEISQAFTAYNTRVISAPAAGFAPIAPQPQKMYVMAFLIGLIIPLVILFFREVSYTKVRGRSDLKKLTVPFLAEIPQAAGRGFGKKNKQSGIESIVVKPHNRNAINEAFRVLRTNLEFVMGRNDKHRVIMITSINPGGGKTFIISNIAMSVAIRNKRVLLIDFDMRKASLSKLVDSPKQGVANYLNGEGDSVKDFIVKSPVHECLDILPVGTLPPNPAELLSEDRMPQMIARLREMYDVIFIDTPPVELVADTSIVNKVSDMTLFVVRAELLEKEMLPVIEKFYQEGTLNNMNIILNGTRDAYGRYGYRRYGYRYGYQYGYGNKKRGYYHSKE